MLWMTLNAHVSIENYIRIRHTMDTFDLTSSLKLLQIYPMN